jgi:hypothetical protein
MEQWKDIKDYEGLYQVSNIGNVKSLNYNRTGKERIVKPGITKGRQRYRHVKLSKNGVCKTFKITRLVAIAFIPNPDNLPTVDHCDRNSLNDSVENLRWANLFTQSNNRDFSNFAKGESIGSSFLKENQVIEIRKLKSEGLSEKKLASLFNCSTGGIRSALKGWKHLKSTNQSN